MRIKKRIALPIFAGLLAYYLVPLLGMQLANLGVFRRGSGAKPEAALTFDDGPDPQTTSQVLDALEGAGVRGTFFVLGQNVQKYPELTRQILSRGHQLELHGFQHRAAWLRSPWGTYLDIKRGYDALLEVTGVAPRFFRPAHGVYTAAVWAALKILKLEAAHWTVEAHDWHAEYGVFEVHERVLAALEPGGVVVLHDAGLGGETCAELLPELLNELKNRDYQLKTLSELHGLRMGSPREVAQRIWKLVDHAWDKQHEVDYLTQNAKSIFRLSLSAMPDLPETPVPAGTICADMHIHSPRMVAVAEHTPLLALRYGKYSMRDLARALRNNPKYQDVPGILTMTMYQGILKTLGFTIYDVPTTRDNIFLTYYLAFLRNLYSSRPNRSLIEPQLAWISREDLMRKYGKE